MSEQTTLFDWTPRSERLRRSFMEFHRANPWVYSRLVEICRELRANGFRRYSMRTLVSVLRFEWDLKTGGQNVILGSGEERRIKLNNNHTPYYARMLVKEHPDFADFFEFRRAEGDEDDDLEPSGIR